MGEGDRPNTEVFPRIETIKEKFFHDFHGFSVALCPRAFACGWKEFEAFMLEDHDGS